VLTLPLPNSSRTTSSTIIQCQMLKLPIRILLRRLSGTSAGDLPALF
jgi:hypothetical protein